ncbi:MAG TPA: recombinase family protein [Planktothrix sp.]|jgi:DNA invertase Pin-like site-specific DNA recombinase
MVQIRAAIYTRVSTDDQNCDRQVRDLTEFAERRGFAIVSVYKEVASGVKDDRSERAKVIAAAKARKIDAILVTELTRWGRSTIDLMTTLQDLASWGVSFIPQTGMQMDLASPMGKLMTTIFAGLAEFERDLLRERTKSGLAAAQARGQVLGRQTGFYPSSKYELDVLKMIKDGSTYREISNKLGISKTTVVEIVKRSRERELSCSV